MSTGETTAATTSRNYRSGSVRYFAAEDADVILEFLKADGTAGTATDGFTRSAPTPGT